MIQRSIFPWLLHAVPLDINLSSERLTLPQRSRIVALEQMGMVMFVARSGLHEAVFLTTGGSP